ncbi:MAG: hypothetical protein MMC23_009959 [Stictis urceolatum]|nr:hypothetical protein [Stictis urceolata]
MSHRTDDTNMSLAQSRSPTQVNNVSPEFPRVNLDNENGYQLRVTPAATQYAINPGTQTNNTTQPIQALLEPKINQFAPNLWSEVAGRVAVSEDIYNGCTPRSLGLSQEDPIDMTRVSAHTSDLIWLGKQNMKKVRDTVQTPSRLRIEVPQYNRTSSKRTKRPTREAAPIAVNDSTRSVPESLSVEPPSSRPSFMSMLADDSEDELAISSFVSQSSRAGQRSYPTAIRRMIVPSNCGLSDTTCKLKFCVRCCDDDELASPA